MTHLIWYDFFRAKFIQEKGVFYYVYQEIFTRRTYRGGRDGCACHTDSALLLYRNTNPRSCICSGLGRMPLRDAARGFQDISLRPTPVILK